MKRVIVLLLVLTVAATSVFASGLLNVGVCAAYSKNVGEVMGAGETLFDDFQMSDLHFGANARAKFLFAEADGKAYFGKTSEDKFEIAGTVEGNLVLSLIIVQLKAGVGVDYRYTSDSFGFGSDGSIADFMQAPLHMNLGLTVDLQAFDVGVYAQLPSSVNLANFNFVDLITPLVGEGWKKASLGVYAGISLF
ncbi:MAG: hypothetical protein HUK24_00150 [Sphaerochaetaceae bacterium]|nr:hypothetical protein [Sphaerochaetaceae bacterium]